MDRQMKKWLLVAVLAVVGAVLAACGNDDVTTASGEGNDKVIKYQLYKGVVYPLELAEDLGYLDGITLESVSDFKGGTESIQLVGTGDIDFGLAFNGAIAKAYSKNVKLVSVVGSYGSDELNNIAAYTLEGSEIKEAKDLIGKKVGVNILGAHMEVVLMEYLKQGGLTDKEIKEVQLVTVPNTSAEQTLRAEQIDAVLLLGAAKDLAVERGGVTELFADIDVIGKNFTAGNYFFSEEYVKKNPEVVKQTVEGIAKAIEWSRETPREEVIERMENIVKKRDPNEAYENLEFWQSFGIAGEGGVIEDEDIQIWVDWLEDNGNLKEGEIKPSDLYTNEYNPYAK